MLYTRRAQYGSIKVYTLNQSMDLYIIEAMLLDEAILCSQGWFVYAFSTSFGRNLRVPYGIIL